MRRVLLLPIAILSLSACQRDVSQTVVLTPTVQAGAQTSSRTLAPAQPTSSPGATSSVATPALTPAAPVAEPANPSSITPPATPPSAASAAVQVLQSACATTPQPLRFSPPPKPSGAITGRVGLFVGRLSRGTKEFQFDRATWLNPALQFPLASNFKTSVLYELMRAVDSGAVKLNERFQVTRANQSYGRYPFDNSDVMALAQAMIAWSDNTATDMLYRRIGLAALHPLVDQLRLCNTRLLLPTKAWWVAQAGFGGTDFPKYALVSASEKFASAPFETQLAMAKRLDAAAQLVGAETLRRALDYGYFAGRNGGVATMSQIDRNLQNASTPQEWARVLQKAFVNPDLTALGAKRFRDVMMHGKGRSFVRVPFTYFGGKSGNTARVLTYSGYIETQSGDRVIYVYMNDSSQNVATRDETPQAFNLINAALKSVMRPEDLVRRKPVIVKPAPIPAPIPLAKPATP